LAAINYFNKNNIFIKRFLSSIVLMIFALYLNHIGGVYFLSILYVALIILLSELYKLFDHKIYNLYFFFNSTVYLGCFILINLDFYFYSSLLFFTGILTTILIFKNKYFFILLVYFYLLLPFILLLLLNKSYEGKITIYWMFLVVWTTDISGYIFGRVIKGPKLLPSVSPNKTWSGLLSGIFLSGILSSFFSIFNNSYQYISYFLLGSLGAIICSMGDLFESKLKRLNNKKDTSNLIPGHGGLLDRLDGFLFAIVYFYTLSFIKEYF